MEPKNNLRTAWQKAVIAAGFGESFSTRRFRKYDADAVIVDTGHRYVAVGKNAAGEALYQKKPTNYMVPGWQDLWFEAREAAQGRFELIQHQKNSLAKGYGWHNRKGWEHTRLEARDGRTLFTRDEAIITLRDCIKTMREMGFSPYGLPPPGEKDIANLRTAAEMTDPQPAPAPGPAA